ncbi:MAG TPA: hypothetical protein DCL73_05505 [Treponema sp.]|nr:hypothetical protein [Treponema sp.]
MFEITSGYQILGRFMVFAGLILTNEIARRSKAGGIFFFIGLPAGLSIYFIVVAVCAAAGMSWALANPTYVHMNSWFHYAKLYAATIGCVGFMMLKYKWSIGKTHWFKAWPFVIVAINILIAVCSDLESAVKGWYTWWLSSEGVWLYGGWHNIFNALAGVLNILCMTGWWGIYSSKKEEDMLWPDMTWVFIVAYDIWNFAYTFNCLPTHAWYCGLALLLAPTAAWFLWNKGGWIQNRAFTLSIWCMFAQVFPLFQDQGRFAVKSVLSASYDPDNFAAAKPQANLIIGVLALAANVIALIIIYTRAAKQHKNPYTHEIFVGTKDYNEAIARAKPEDIAAAGM